MLSDLSVAAVSQRPGVVYIRYAHRINYTSDCRAERERVFSSLRLNILDAMTPPRMLLRDGEIIISKICVRRSRLPTDVNIKK